MKRSIAFFLLVALIFCNYGCGYVYIPEKHTKEAESTAETFSDTAASEEKQTEAESETEKQYEERRVRLVACGDNIVYYGNVRDAADGNGGYDFKPSFTDIEPIIKSADISFINQETLMCGEGWEFSYYPTFNGPQEMGKNLVEVGFNVINIANNHMLDKGEAGLLATIDFWKTQPVLLVGGYEDEYDYDNIRLIKKNGITVAFLSYTYWTNGISLKPDAKTAVPYFDEETIKRQVALANEKADFIIVSAHWGDENTFNINAEQNKYAQLCADLGVDLIIGHHPHVLQKAEWIESTDSKSKTLCLYSIGNLMAEMERDINMVSLILNTEIVSENGEHPHLENVKLIPVVFDFTLDFYDNHVYLLENFTAEMAKAHGIRAYGNSTTIERLRSIVTDNIAEEFLPESFLNKA